MSDTPSLLSTLKELLHEARPSRTLWLKVCDLFEPITDEEQIEAIALESEPLFSDWSEPQRFTPEEWIDRLLEGEPLDCMIVARTLDLRGKQLVYVDADLLSQSPELLHIRRLNLAYNGFQNAGTRALLSTDVVKNLTHLDLSGNSVELEGVRAIAECSHLENLQHLDMTGNWVNDEGAKLLANSPHLQNLKTLVLRGNPIKQAGAAALANSPYLNAQIRQRWSNG